MRKHLSYLFILVVIFSCSKEKVGPQCINCEEELSEVKANDVLIVNEGNFGFGNASLSLYHPNTKQSSPNIYQQINSIPLGDVAQSVTQISNSLYVVVNNSNKVEVVDVTSFNSIATITGFNSPRYLLPVNNYKAYVTDLYSNSIQIVNLNSNSITGNIPVNGWTEQLLLHNDTVYVCDMTNNNLLIIDPSTDLVVDSVKMGVNPNSIVKDEQDKVWVLCSGGFQEDNPKLIKFNPENRTIENTFVFSDINDSPGSLSINKNQLYFINTDVFKMSIAANGLPSSPFVSSNSNIFYSVGVDAINNEVYIADAIDYVQNSVIYRYGPSGNLIDQFAGGIITGNFHFIE